MTLNQHVTIPTDAHLAEYKQLKDEQRHRIGVRDNLIYSTFTATAAVVAFAFTGLTPRFLVLLLLPPVTIVLGWTYLCNDRKITEIGTYIRDELTVAVTGQRSTPVFGWEQHRRGPGVYRRYRKVAQAVVDLTAFVAPGVVAVLVYAITVPVLPVVLVLVSGVEVFGLMCLGAEILRHADIRKERRDW